jgi:hypothetical protein
VDRAQRRRLASSRRVEKAGGLPNQGARFTHVQATKGPDNEALLAAPDAGYASGAMDPDHPPVVIRVSLRHVAGTYRGLDGNSAGDGRELTGSAAGIQREPMETTAATCTKP